MSNFVNIRASSLPGLFDCPARFEATQIRGLHAPSTGKAVLGRAVHASTAVYDVARLNGDFDLTADDTAGVAADLIHNPEEEVAWDETLPPAAAEKIALGLHSLYCGQIAPAMTYAAVEVTCETLNIIDLGITLTGTVDRVYLNEDGEIGVADIKTGARAVAAGGKVETSDHAYQVGVYELLAQMATGRALTAPAKIIPI